MQFGGQDWSAAAVAERAGRARQVCGVRAARLMDGSEAGVRAVDLLNERLRVTVYPDRGMDVGPLWYKGLQLTWESPTGAVHPALVDTAGHGWGRGFHGGLAVTCGLENVGPACEDEGVPYGQHGTLSYTPARSASWRESVVGGRLRAEAEGEVAGYGGLVFTRRVRVESGSPAVVITDKVRNPTPVPVPWMIQYHINFGFPLVSETAEALIPPGRPAPRDDEAAGGLATWSRVEPPREGYREQVFCHRQPADRKGHARCALVNDALGLGVLLEYPAALLPFLWQWRVFAPHRYVLALEPSNCAVKPRHRARQEGLLPELAPFSQVQLELKVTVVEGPAGLKRLRESLQ
jgi:hypothetical protein